MRIKFPHVEVQLTGTDGNAFAVIGKVRSALRHEATRSELEDFTNEATSGDYDNVLQTCMKWVSVS